MKNILLVAFVLLSCVLHGQWSFNAISSGIESPGNTASGDGAIAMGLGTTASALAATSMGLGTNASIDISTSMGHFTAASAFAATSMGDHTSASGYVSTAMGAFTTASGDYSTAMGGNTTASGDYSTAMGDNTTAEGKHSTTMGSGTTASGFGTFAIGRFNTIDATANPTSFSPTNRAFVIGNGSFGSESDAMTVLFDGTTTVAGSMTATSFIGDGSQLSNLPISGLESVAESSSSGWRLIGADPLNYGDIGQNAIDLSISNTSSTTRGATGSNSVAMGDGSTASGESATSIGFETLASGEASIAIGKETTASGSFSTATGLFTKAIGNNSTSMGRNTTASGYSTTAIGQYNTIDGNADPALFQMDNRALVIGNGTSIGSESDAMTVLFDGTTTVAGDLTVNSDARLKSNISSLGNTLPMLKMLDGKTYNLKSNESQEKIGLLAQDVQKVFPQLVRSSKDDHATLSLNYQGLIPVLINAVNEQQNVIEKQQEQIDKLTSLVESLISDKQE